MDMDQPWQAESGESTGDEWKDEDDIDAEEDAELRAAMAQINAAMVAAGKDPAMVICRRSGPPVVIPLQNLGDQRAAC